METLNIKSTHKESQGDYVVINAENFDPETMELYNPDPVDQVVDTPRRGRPPKDEK